jgi:putative ABC transport system ATP-binding protein
MASIIELKNVEKIYNLGETVVNAIKNINLKIDKGEFVAIIGPSGSGKSTLMHMIGLLDTPTKGVILVNKKDASKLTPNERAKLRNEYIGFVFQTFNLLSRTTAVDNVELPLIYAGKESEERKRLSTEALIKVGLENRLKHFPNQLSGGQQQRVAIARALVNNPDIILADEPTGNLDSKSGKEILKLLAKLNKEGNTIVLVTHDKNVASYAERVVELKDGHIIKDKKK